jgi:hypothetical protein
MTDKEKAIRDVIIQRVDILDKILENKNLSPMDKSYYQGKRDGLMQGHDLVGASLGSIEVELKP